VSFAIEAQAWHWAVAEVHSATIAMSVAVQLASPLPRKALPLESSASDEELVARIIAGERRLYAVLIRRNNQRLFRVARSILRNDQDAEDVVQTAYVRAFDKLDQFRADAKFATWLTRITVNEALHSLNARKRQALIALEQDAEQLPSSGSQRTPEDMLHRRQLQKLLERCIDALPETLRTVLVMRDVQELSTQDTAQSLGITEEAVRVRLHRARNLMEERIGGVRASSPEAFTFLGERCERILAAVTRVLNLA
jgi:RNA polymerase sigma-70 factor, ECF subfamily